MEILCRAIIEESTFHLHKFEIAADCSRLFYGLDESAASLHAAQMQSFMAFRL